jgi:hypothetical protein
VVWEVKIPKYKLAPISSQVGRRRLRGASVTSGASAGTGAKYAASTTFQT